LGTEKVVAFTEDMVERVGQYEAILDRNEIFLQRPRASASVPPDRCSRSGHRPAPGAAGGNPWNLRKADPYKLLRTLEFKGPDRDRRATATTATACGSPRSASSCGDHSARRGGPAGGPVDHDHRKVALPPRHELATSMEALIHHFKLVHRGAFRVPRARRMCRSRARAASSAASSSRTGRQSRSACTCARPVVSVNLQALRENVRRRLTSPDIIVNLAMLDRSWEHRSMSTCYRVGKVVLGSDPRRD